MVETSCGFFLLRNSLGSWFNIGSRVASWSRTVKCIVRLFSHGKKSGNIPRTRVRARGKMSKISFIDIVKQRAIRTELRMMKPGETISV
jgi:hypothetical protein